MEKHGSNLMKDVYWSAYHYDLMHEDTKMDFELYLNMAKQFSGSILELACGTGRITLMLAKAGHEICGIDLLSDFIQAAERKRLEANLKNASFYVKDIRHFDLRRIFSFIFIPFNSFAHVYTPEDAKSMFRCVKRHMDRDSRFLINIFNPRLDLLCRDSSERYPVASYLMPETGEKVVVTENNHYDRATQINHIKWYFKAGDRKEFIRELPMRIYYPAEIDYLLDANGFEIIEKWGNYQLEQFSSGSELQIIFCRRQK